MSAPEVPIQIPLFPLPDAVLFPGAQLPLHVFEPRYREMTEDVLAADGLIGIVLLRSGVDVDQSRPAIYAIGCAGSLQNSRKLADGRFLIELRGEFRFQILDEVQSPKPYRIALAEPLTEADLISTNEGGSAGDPMPAAYSELESQVLELMRLSAPRSEPLLRRRLPELAGSNLVNALAAGIDCLPTEKQGLLEAPSSLHRCRQLSALIQFRIAELQFPAATRLVN